MTYREPPNIDPAKLDFSEFHPLDHQPWESRCKAFYGGWKHHIKIDWELRRGPDIRAWFGRLFFCWRGHHKPRQGWQRRHKDDEWITWITCWWCCKKLSNSQPK